MRVLFVTVIALVISSSTFAAPKLVVCETFQTREGHGTCEVGDVFRRQHFLVDTDDFNKESPEYEYRLDYSCLEKGDEFNKTSKFGASTRTMMGYQNKYRYNYDVTATTLTFHYNMFPSGHMKPAMKKLDMNRETLTTENTTCTIKEVKLNNKI